MEQYGILTTRDINLAAALTSCEVPFLAADPIRRVTKDGKEICLFNFESGKGGEEIVKAWGDKNFIDENPEHPTAYLKAFAHNRDRLLDLVKQSPRVQIVQKDGMVYLVPIKREAA